MTDLTSSSVPVIIKLIGLTFMVGFATSLLVCVLVVTFDVYRGAAKSGRAPFKKRKFSLNDLKDFSLQYWVTCICIALFYAGLYSFVANDQLFFTSKFGLSTKQANTAC